MDEQAHMEEQMRRALVEARRAFLHRDVPVGALVLDAQGELLGIGHNERELRGDPTAHAEVLAIRQAAERVGNWRLVGATLYVTQEPCPMCAGALVNARVGRLVYGCDNPKAGAARTLYGLCNDPRLNHRLEVVSGVLADDSAALLRSFFGNLRTLARYTVGGAARGTVQPTDLRRDGRAVEGA